MKGRYKIKVDSPDGDIQPWDRWRRDHKSNWSIVIRTCQLLARDGLKYRVELHLLGTDPHVLITSSGVSTKRRAVGMLLKFKPSEPLTPKQCKVKRLEAQKVIEVMRGRMKETLTQRSYRGRWRYRNQEDWQILDARRRAVGKWLRRRLSGEGVNYSVTPKDYRELDKLCGRRVIRMSEIPEKRQPEGIKDYVLKELVRVNKYDKWEPETFTPFPFAEYQLAMLDVEYWIELEVLSGDRDKFKPGLTEENYRERVS